MEQLTLPEPAATILAHTHDILDRHVTPHTPGGDGWKIGGGTILAARWAHRQSEDIDLLVHPNTDTSHLEHRINPELSARMREVGATYLDFETLPTIHFDNGRIEILARYPSPGSFCHYEIGQINMGWHGLMIMAQDVNSHGDLT